MFLLHNHILLYCQILDKFRYWLKRLAFLQKKSTAKPYSFLVIGATLAPDNPSCFWKNLLERIWKLIITIDDNIKDQKLKYNINREVGLSLDKIDKYILRVK